MTNPHETAERIVLKVINLITTPNILIETFQESLTSEIKSALTKAHDEERNALADKLEEMAIATYGQKIVEQIPISSDILLAWVKPLRSGERAFGPSTCTACHHEISHYCNTCLEKANEEGRKEMREEVIKVALAHEKIHSGDPPCCGIEIIEQLRERQI